MLVSYVNNKCEKICSKCLPPCEEKEFSVVKTYRLTDKDGYIIYNSLHNCSNKIVKGIATLFINDIILQWTYDQPMGKRDNCFRFLENSKTKYTATMLRGKKVASRIPIFLQTYVDGLRELTIEF